MGIIGLHLLNRMNTLSETCGHSATLIENSTNIYFYLFSILNYETEQNKTHKGQLLFS